MNKWQLQKPVCFIIFNRPDTTQKVFNAIRQAKPPKLLVIADGARTHKNGEAEQCQETRAIINQVDWDCEVLTNYSDVNLGCRKRISSGLNWVFEQVKEAIILEDDCLPHPTFFRYCQELLDKYRDELKIMHISGQNLQLGQKRRNYSYYFSRYNHCWGWATWRRAWQLNDDEMKFWPKFREENWLYDVLQDEHATRHWTGVFQSMYEGYDTWDYPWLFNCWANQGLVILPNINLVSNIGFGDSATRTKNTGSILANMPVEEMEFPLKHPPFMIRETLADTFTERTFYSGNPPQQKIINIKEILYHTLACLNQPRDKIDLARVTLVAVSSVDIEMTLLSLAISSLNINFYKILLFTSEEVENQYQKLFPTLEIITIKRINNLADYSKFIIKELNCFIDSDYCLITQGDGFIVNPYLWRDDFLDYDYIGAPWPKTLNLRNKQGETTEVLDMNQNRVGNGGFSLRSKKLLNASSSLNLDDIQTSSKSEDLIICHYYYKLFKQKNIKFAPLEIAAKFSFEQPVIEYQNWSWQKTFGFHGKYSLDQVLIEISSHSSSIYQESFISKAEQDKIKAQFNLRAINLILFPNWNAEEEALLQALGNTLKTISNHPQAGEITLLLDLQGISPEDADLALSSAVMNLMMEEGVELREDLEVSPVGELDRQSRETLLSLVDGRISLETEKLDRVTEIGANELSTYTLENLNKISEL